MFGIRLKRLRTEIENRVDSVEERIYKLEHPFIFKVGDKVKYQACYSMNMCPPPPITGVIMAMEFTSIKQVRCGVFSAFGNNYRVWPDGADDTTSAGPMIYVHESQLSVVK